MALAQALVDYAGALRADFQRFYNLNLDDMGDAFSYEHAAELAAHLPYGSALRRAVDPSQEWSQEAYILAQIEYDLRCMTYSGKGPEPKPVKTPADGIKAAAPVASRAEMKRVADALGIPENQR